MANKGAYGYLTVFALLVIVLAGSWAFMRLVLGRAALQEVEDMYVEDGESVGIFDRVPPEELEQARAIAAEALQGNIIVEEEAELETPKDVQLPNQMIRAELADIAGIAPKEESLQQKDEQALRAPVDLQLSGNEVVRLAAIPGENIAPGEEGAENITLIAAPVRYEVIHNTQEYKEFKRRARGSYPEVDFTKQMLLVLESDSNLPDKVFELVDAKAVDGNLQVTYRVNVFKLDEKINSHTVLPVAKTKDPIELKQVL